MRNAPTKNQWGHSHKRTTLSARRLCLSARRVLDCLIDLDRRAGRGLILDQAVDRDEGQEREEDPQDRNRDPDDPTRFLVVDRPVAGGPRAEDGDDHHVSDQANDGGLGHVVLVDPVRHESSDDERGEESQDGQQDLE